LKWEPGGEDILGLLLDLDRPWWSSCVEPSHVDIVMSESVSNTTTDSEPTTASSVEDQDEDDSTPRYRYIRKSDPSYTSRHVPLSSRCDGLLSLPFIIVDIEDARPGITRGTGDGGCSKGWYCSSCGKMNRQTMFRRRKCTSSFCKEFEATPPAIIGMDTIREPGDRLPMVLPVNLIPLWIDPRLVEWGDGMKTLSYTVREAESRPVMVKHVFTGNITRLQAEQTQLFEEVQKEVVMTRAEQDFGAFCADHLC